MPMTYTSLIGPKGTAGSIMGWVNYTKLDVETVVDEAQSLLYNALRVRNMREEWIFGVAVGQSSVVLPDRYLDPVGPIYDVTNNTRYNQRIEGDIASHRIYEPSTGTMGNNPFSATINSSLVTVTKAAHGLTQGSTVFYAGAAAVGGLIFNGAFPVISVIDANTYVIDMGTDATATAIGGGAAVTFDANALTSGSPSRWAVWNERMQFDTAFDRNATLKQLYYRSPKLLSASNPSNWLTSRYPMLMRKACQAAAADFMKDDNEYQKSVQALNNLIGNAATNDDMIYRGAEFGTDTP